MSLNQKKRGVYISENTSGVKRILKKIIIPVLVVSLALNLFFAFYTFYEKKKRKERLGDATYHILLNIDEVNKDLNHIHFPFNPKKQKDYKIYLSDAVDDLYKNEGWINAHVGEMPQNLVSWHSGMSADLGIALTQLKSGDHEDRKRFKKTVTDLKRFARGYQKEGYSAGHSYYHPHQALSKIEDVISSKKYMKNRFIYKDK